MVWRNAAIELGEHADAATEAASEALLFADAAQTEADHCRYLAENPPNTEQTTLFAYDASGHLIGEYDETGALIREHLWLGDQPFATLTQGATYNVQADHLNTPVSMTDQAGALVWQASREPFGKTTLTVASFEQNLRFPGQYFDQETQLHQNWNREYDPGSGRYTQEDPIGLGDGPNTYLYAGANPVAFVDADGLTKWQARIRSFSVSAVVGGGGVFIEAETKCISGKKGKVVAVGIGPVLGVGTKWSRGSGGSELVEFDDYAYGGLIEPHRFNGAFMANTAGAVVVGGKSATQMKCGRVYAKFVGTDFGLDVGISGTLGTCTVLSSSIEECCGE